MKNSNKLLNIVFCISMLVLLFMLSIISSGVDKEIKEPLIDDGSISDEYSIIGGFSDNISNSEVPTSKRTVEDMVVLLSSDVLYPDAKHLNSTGGRFLVGLYQGLMNTESRVIIWVLLLAVLGIILKLYVIGEPIDKTQVYCNTSVIDKRLELQFIAKEYGVALRGWKLEQKGNILFVSARKVLVSPLFNKMDYKTIIDLELIDNILFKGKENWLSKGKQNRNFDIFSAVTY